jgi:hypothetical protein
VANTIAVPVSEVTYRRGCGHEGVSRYVRAGTRNAITFSCGCSTRSREFGRNMTNAWTFGWTQLLTIVGIGTTACFAYCGLRTFDKWRREKLEEKKIEVAVEALALAYQSKYVFEYIRQRAASSYEYEDMPKIEGEEDEEREQRSYYAALKHIKYHKDFFEKVWKIQPKFMAIFGSETETIFQLLHSARREIESAISVMSQLKKPINKEENLKLWVNLRRTVWSSNGATAKEDDQSGQGSKVYAGPSSIGSSTRINQR